MERAARMASDGSGGDTVDVDGLRRQGRYLFFTWIAVIVYLIVLVLLFQPRDLYRTELVDGQIVEQFDYMSLWSVQFVLIGTAIPVLIIYHAGFRIYLSYLLDRENRTLARMRDEAADFRAKLFEAETGQRAADLARSIGAHFSAENAGECHWCTSPVARQALICPRCRLPKPGKAAKVRELNRTAIGNAAEAAAREQ